MRSSYVNLTKIALIFVFFEKESLIL